MGRALCWSHTRRNVVSIKVVQKPKEAYAIKVSGVNRKKIA